MTRARGRRGEVGLICPSPGHEKGACVRTRFVVPVIVGALAFGLFRFAAGAGALDTLRALPAAQQRPAPAFTLPDLHGASTRLVDLRGKVVVVRFWVTW
jgi:cytochrome oxidase Cu insertion factor (SCO1/SenC/PrrC family)